MEVTQKHIEDLAPKLIVHANRDSMCYWGINKNADGIKIQYNNTQDPWMGYKVERVLEQELPECMKKYDRYTRFPFYRIIGFINNNKRINNNYFTDTNLIGSYILEYVMEYRSKEEKNTLYNTEEWKTVWDWAQNN